MKAAWGSSHNMYPYNETYSAQVHPNCLQARKNCNNGNQEDCNYYAENCAGEEVKQAHRQNIEDRKPEVRDVPEQMYDIMGFKVSKMMYNAIMALLLVVGILIAALLIRSLSRWFVSKQRPHLSSDDIMPQSPKYDPTGIRQSVPLWRRQRRLSLPLTTEDDEKTDTRPQFIRLSRGRERQAEALRKRQRPSSLPPSLTRPHVAKIADDEKKDSPLSIAPSPSPRSRSPSIEPWSYVSESKEPVFPLWLQQINRREKSIESFDLSQ